MIELLGVSYTYPETEAPVFAGLTVTLPPGVVSFVGANGTGKSTLLLLAGGRLLPNNGTVRVLGKQTADMHDEEERNRYVSFIYQNMEFETEEPIGALMEYIHEHGCHEEKDQELFSRLISVFELDTCLDLRLQKLSKGQMQRAILAFSVLYGSRIIMMDEPVFALEDYQKRRAMQFLVDYSRERKVSVYYSAHEIEISQRYSDTVLLFYKSGLLELGPTADILTAGKLENAYEFPRAMLHQKEHLFRESLVKIHSMRRPGQAPE